MSLVRAQLVDQKFLDFLAACEAPGVRAGADLDAPVAAGTTLSARDALDLFESQMITRHLDIAAREMKARDESFYTIGSAGHEGNAVLGKLLRPTDPALLHYRSGAFVVQRVKAAPGRDPVRDIALSLAASSEDPVAGGRHKVFGAPDLQIFPTTSTIASQLPRAVGLAFALERKKHLGLASDLPDDSIVAVSFGDATTNHSTFQGALNAAQWAAFQHLPVPLLLICEDNGIGISVRTPHGWIAANFSRRPGLRYFRADGTDLRASWDVAREAVDACRSGREPVFLHLEMTRMLGHAGSDVEGEYRTPGEIDAGEARDPLIRTARTLIEGGFESPESIRTRYAVIRERVQREAARAATRPKLNGAKQVLAALSVSDPAAVAKEAARKPGAKERAAMFGGALPEKLGKPRHLAMLLNWGLADILAKYPEAIVFGEDVAKKGGVYHVTADLSKKAGVGRVFNTLLDETTIFGIALGAGQLGMLPSPEIQYLAYYHNAEDQIRGEAASMMFFSNGRVRNPMVVRVASYAYQKGFGGHFHNDNSIAALRDVPGIVIASPSRGDDAVGMLRTAYAMAKVEGKVVMFLEPIALYMTKDLYAEKDGRWSFRYPAPGESVACGEGRVYRDGKEDLTIVTYGNGVWMSLRAAKTLKDEHGLRARVLDLRWLQPLNAAQIVREVKATGRALIVDECRRTGGMNEPVAAAILRGLDSAVPVEVVAAEDTYIPLGPAANAVLPSEDGIVAAALKLAKPKKKAKR